MPIKKKGASLYLMVVNKSCVRHSQHWMCTCGKTCLLLSGEENNQSSFLLKFLGCFIWSCACWVNLFFQCCQKNCFGISRISSLVLHEVLEAFYFISNGAGNWSMNCVKNITFLFNRKLNFFLFLICFKWFISVYSKPFSW